MTHLASAQPEPVDDLRAALRQDVRVVAQVYNLDNPWLERLLSGRHPSRLTVREVRKALGLGDGPVAP